MEDKVKDLCESCEHFWLDFPMPAKVYISHCEVLDKNGGGLLDEVVKYPCNECPFKAYKVKSDHGKRETKSL